MTCSGREGTYCGYYCYAAVDGIPAVAAVVSRSRRREYLPWILQYHAEIDWVPDVAAVTSCSGRGGAYCGYCNVV